MSARQSWSSGPLFPGRLLIWPEIATGRPPSQTVVLGLSGQSRSGSRWIPSVESCASASATRRPAMTRSGAISASGTSTKARSNSPRMRQRQFRLVEPDIVIGDQIEVEGARTPARLLRAVAAELLLDLVQREQQRMRVEAGFDLDAGVGETAPAVPRPRAGWCSRRNARAGRPASCRKYWRWPFECRADVADIAAERDQHVRHVRAIAACASAPRRHPRRSRQSAHAACAR